ncbi:MAG: hypothetical protein ACTSWQ_11345 [Candidatus Thorarchaeota archaeon]
MPTSGRLYLIKDEISLSDAYDKLDGWEDRADYEEFEVEENILVAGVQGLHYDDEVDELSGVFKWTKIHRFLYEGKVTPTFETRKAPFKIRNTKNGIILLLMKASGAYPLIAQRINYKLFDTTTGIIKAELTTNQYKEMLSDNDEDTKVAFYRNVDLPGIKTLALYGKNLVQTDLWGQYTNIADPSYVMVKARTRNQEEWTVGVGKEGNVCVFSSCELDEYVEFVFMDIVPYLYRRQH